MQNYSNVENIAAINALTLGYELGAGSVTGATDAKQVLEYLSTKVQTELDEIRKAAQDATAAAKEAKSVSAVVQAQAATKLGSPLTVPVYLTVVSYPCPAPTCVDVSLIL